MNEMALFAGAGGRILGGHLLGWRTVCAVEWEAYPASVLLARQNDGLLPPFPIWDDVQTFDGKAWAGIVDVISGGFPCQDISYAGKGAGLHGEKSSLFFEAIRVVRELKPRAVVIENVAELTVRGLDRVLCEIAKSGYDAEWRTFSCYEFGGHHRRERVFIVATRPHSNSFRLQGRTHSHEAAFWSNEEFTRLVRDVLRSAVPAGKYGRVSDGVPNRIHRLRGLGNAVAPQVAEWIGKQVVDYLESE